MESFVRFYKRTTLNFATDTVWQTLDYYPLEQVVRQSDIIFSSVLTKFGKGDELHPQHKKPDCPQKVGEKIVMSKLAFSQLITISVLKKHII